MKFFGFNITPVWALSLVRTFLYSLIVTGGALEIALTAKAWGDRSGSEQCILLLKLMGVQTGVILAFMDQTIAKLQGAETPGQTKPS